MHKLVILLNVVELHGDFQVINLQEIMLEILFYFELMLQQDEFVHVKSHVQLLLLIDHYLMLLLYHQYQPDHHVLEISDLNNHKESLKQDLIHLLTKM